MRKITEEATNAFLAGQSLSKQNMTVGVRQFQDERHESVIMSLHGNPIARYPVGDFQSLYICDGGWQTATTKDRLNALPGVSVHQKNGDWFLNGEPWDGRWTKAAKHFEVKQLSKTQWQVLYPRGTKREPVSFTNEDAATAFMHVEAANMGFKIVRETERVITC